MPDGKALLRPKTCLLEWVSGLVSIWIHFERKEIAQTVQNGDAHNSGASVVRLACLCNMCALFSFQMKGGEGTCVFRSWQVRHLLLAGDAGLVPGLVYSETSVQPARPHSVRSLLSG